MDLPTGLTARSLTLDDAPDVHQLFRAAEIQDLGESLLELGEVLGSWARPSFDLATESVGVYEGERLVAAAQVYRTRRIEATVHPNARGRGVGSWLAGWTRECSRRHGGTLVGQTVEVGGSAEALLRGLGYRTGWQAWVLQVPPGAQIEPQPLPPGYTLRDARRGEDDQIAHQLIEDAFNEWPDRDPIGFDDWAAGAVRRPGFEPWQLRLAMAPDGEPVAVAFSLLADGCGYVDQLATRKDHRGRGLARALLVDAFAAARVRGATRCELSTDSRTGALPLYEHVGMTVVRSYQHWMTDL